MHVHTFFSVTIAWECVELIKNAWTAAINKKKEREKTNNIHHEIMIVYSRPKQNDQWNMIVVRYFHIFSHIHLNLSWTNSNYNKRIQNNVQILTSSNPDIVWRHCGIFDTNVDVVGEL